MKTSFSENWLQKRKTNEISKNSERNSKIGPTFSDKTQPSTQVGKIGNQVDIKLVFQLPDIFNSMRMKRHLYLKKFCLFKGTNILVLFLMIC